jgi:chemotaxis protein MotB
VEAQAKAPIIIKKVVKRHGGHHGGAWKVAYADFVTAMMALFIVLWLVNTDDQTKKAISGYFKDPTGASKELGSGAAGSGDNLTVQQRDMSKLKETIEGIMKDLPEMSNNMMKQVQMTVTGEGLRIDLVETEKGMFFETGNAQPTGSGKNLLAALAAELKKMPNNVLVEGHTDSRPFAASGGYSNWELSTDRANAARRTLEAAGLPDGRIKQVRGFADQRLKMPAEPQSASNRRVSVVVEYKNAPAKAAAPAGKQAPAAHGQPSHGTSHSATPHGA